MSEMKICCKGTGIPGSKAEQRGHTILRRGFEKSIKSILRSNPSSSHGAEVHRQPERERKST